MIRVKVRALLMSNKCVLSHSMTATFAISVFQPRTPFPCFSPTEFTTTESDCFAHGNHFTYIDIVPNGKLRTRSIQPALR